MINTFATEIIPLNDEQRLEALRRYQILDTPPEEAFTNIAHIIQQVFDVPIALISLVDKERVFFKANVGMGGVKQVDRGTSLCSLAIMNTEPTVFENTLTEPCLLANPLVTGQFGLRFYAGAPIITPDGYSIGTVCIVDKKDRVFPEKLQELLKRFAANIMHEIELRLAANKRAEDLEVQVNERTQELLQVNHKLVHTNRELERTNQELEQYAYAASHDLQEPLRKIKTFSDLIIKKYNSDIKNGARVYLSKISDAASRMSYLIKDVLALSKIREVENEFKWVDLNHILDYTLQNLDLEIQQKGATIKSDPMPNVLALEVQMTQLFQNLLSNALKFAKPGTPVTIELKCRQVNLNEMEVPVPCSCDAQDYYLLSFTDNGIGFNPRFSEKIFALFNRLHHMNEYSGTGIGLALCKKIVHIHGGAIWAESQEGEGATFHVLLPIMEQP